MNLVLSFLSNNWHRLALQRFGDSTRLSCVMLTPRFRASSHVICFVLTEGQSEPIFVVKLPRLPGDHSRLDREAANLHAANHNRAPEDVSIPRVVAYEDFHQHRLLIETAVPGRTMSPAVVRRQPELCTETAITWLTNLQLATVTRSATASSWFERLIEEPLLQFKKTLPANDDTVRLIDATVALLQSLRHRDIPLVMSHEDFSPPNILLTEKGNIGVVDWELAEPQGLPASDFFFFLTYIAFARNGARKNAEYIKAFQQAFFGANTWSQPYARRYGESLKIPQEILKPLFVATWSRYVTGLIARLQESGEGSTVGNATVQWLKTNRYYVLWRYAIEHVDALNF